VLRVNQVSGKVLLKEVEKSAHLVFDRDKLEQLVRQLAVCAESKGTLRMVIVGNANQVAEIYLNNIQQQLAREFRKEFPALARKAVAESRDELVKRLKLGDIEKLVDEYVTVEVSKWGRLK